MSEDQDHGFTPLLDAAVHAHELFLAFQDAGFTEEQALKIVIAVLTNRAE